MCLGSVSKIESERLGASTSNVSWKPTFAEASTESEPPPTLPNSLCERVSSEYA